MSENRDFGSEVRQQDKEMEELGDVSDEVAPSSATPKPESVEPSQTGRPGKEAAQEDTAATNKIYHSPSTKIDIFANREFLFKMRVTRKDVMQGSLFIPAEIALHHFPPPPPIHQPREENIKISNLRNILWSMTIAYDHEDCGYVINSQWQQFAVVHKVQASDVLFFYKPSPDANDNHYLIIVFNTHQEHNTVPEFKQENYLFQKELNDMDVSFMLSLPREEVNFHFPAVKLAVETHKHKHQRLYLTDARNKDWCVTIKFFSENYMILNGWGELVEEQKLEIGDVIRFYKPVRPFDSRHFLIQHVRRGVAVGSNDPTQPGSGNAGKDGKGGNKQGKSGGWKRFAGGRSGRKFSTGHCCMA